MLFYVRLCLIVDIDGFKSFSKKEEDGFKNCKNTTKDTAPRIDWSQSMQRDPCNRKLACFDLGNDGTMTQKHKNGQGWGILHKWNKETKVKMFRLWFLGISIYAHT